MKKVNLDSIFRRLDREIPDYKVPVIELIEAQTHDPFKILVGTILSARTKDEVTSQAATRLFTKVKKPEDLNKITQTQIEKLIYPVGFYKTKAKHLKQLPRALEEFNNTIPKTIDELTKLPGVGRKTANLVVTVAFNDDAICVDTHVHRITNRWGYLKTKTPHETEMALRNKLPKKYWKKINWYLVAYGQHLCKPISPFCSKCPIIKWCNQINVNKTR